ncbi:MAG TPA: hypothetical protein VMD91_15965 [Candidatus Sulfotelmatobacter sp.]|nr:hypothetical protein [Candidatus Sulfotelmatobacter sp.]
MRTFRSLARLGALALLLLAAPRPVLAAQQVSGDWSVHERPGPPARLALRLDTDDADFSSDRYAPADLGLSLHELDAPGHHVTFTINRDAGRFACDGWVGGGSGAGTFTFTPNPGYLDALRQRGLAPPSDERLFSAASLDLSLAYVDAMRAALPAVDFHDLITLRAMRIDTDYIRLAEAHGFHNLSAAELIRARALRIF